MICGNCGSRKIKKVDIKNSTMLWNDYKAVFVTEPLELLKCQDCDELILNAKQAKELDAVIEKSITNQVNMFIEQILKREKCTQIELAEHLGISDVYLSEIKSGKKIPKFQAFNFLKTLALNPKSFEISAPSYNKKMVG